ncbi:restriction endonuclease subunit S [Roseovarius sp. MS2]|uniref:restriction endonuclease subunit S n=1 Tax=Roseovarius sp. MS2 TaxID=3390728 RepID=UPI003EDC5117
MMGLPQGWAAPKLEEVCDFNPKHSSDADQSQLASFVPMPAVSEHSGAIDGAVDRPLSEIWKGYTHFADSDVIFAKITPCMENGKAAVARGLTNGIACGSTEFHVLRSKGAVLPEYVWRFMRQDSFRRDAEAHMSGAVGQRRVPKPYLEQHEIPLPPLPEQRRIVRKLDTLSARSTTARTHLTAIEKLVERYKESVRQQAFVGVISESWREHAKHDEDGSVLLDRVRHLHKTYWLQMLREKMPAGRPTSSDATLLKKYQAPERLAETDQPHGVPQTWTWAAAEEIVEPGAEIVYGIVQPGPKLENGIPYVRGMDIVNGVIQTGQLLKTSPEIAQKYERASLNGNDILLGIIRATKVAIVPPEIEGANITQGTARFRPSCVISTEFLAHWLSSKTAQSWLHAKYRGIDMPGLNLRDVRRVPVPLPPLEEQREIVRRIETAFAKIDRLKAEAAKAVKLLGHLDQRILAKAFAGDLVPQDPNDESAETLLARIREDRLGQPAARRRRRREA